MLDKDFTNSLSATASKGRDRSGPISMFRFIISMMSSIVSARIFPLMLISEIGGGESCSSLEMKFSALGSGYHTQRVAGVLVLGS